MARDNEVSVSFKADTSDYESGVDRAARKTEGFRDSTLEATSALSAQMDTAREVKDAIGDIATSASGLRRGMEDLNIATAKQTEGFKKIEGTADLAEGAMVNFVNIGILRANEQTKNLATSVGMLASATWAIGATLAAVTAKSKEEAAAYGALAGATWGLTIAQIALASAKEGAKMGPLAAVTIPIMIAAVGAGIGAGVALAAKSKGARYGMHETVEGPQMIYIEPGMRERVDITPAAQAGTHADIMPVAHSSSGQAPGLAPVHNHIYIDSREITTMLRDERRSGY